MIKVIIVEDEFAGQELLSQSIKLTFPECEIVAIVASVDNAVEAINKHQPDLVFLDVQIKGGTGFDVLRKLAQRNFELIFVTAYNTYAIQAIKNQAIDYILKPINAAEFNTGVQKAIGVIKNKRLLTSKINKSKTISIYTNNETVLVPISEIYYLEAQGSYTNIYTATEKHLSSKNIGEYQSLLTDTFFYRTHHSYIINTNYMLKVTKNRSGVIEMKSGQMLPISQRKMKEFVSLFIQK